MRKKVYVLNDAGLDYSKAESFGDIVYCTRGALPKWDTTMMYRELEDALLDAGEHDYILVGSLSTLVGIASAMMAHRFGQVHYLVYKDGKYLERDIMLED